MHYKRIFYKNSDSNLYIDLKNVKNRYPIYSVDLSDQPKRISDAKSNIILSVDFNKPDPAPTGADEGTICYIVVVSKYLFLYETIKNIIAEKIN